MRDIFLEVEHSGGSIFNLDFRRFAYLHVPKHVTGKIERVDGRTFAELLYEAVSTSDWSGPTRFARFENFRLYVSNCDAQGLDPLSSDGVLSFIGYLSNCHSMGKLIDSTCRSIYNNVKSVLQAIDNYDIIPPQSPFRRTQTRNTEAYSDNDFKRLLPLMTLMFNQLYTQLFQNPQHYLEGAKKFSNYKDYEYSMTFSRFGKEHKIFTPLGKLACLSCLLLSYYTWGNTSLLLKLQRPELDTLLADKWAAMPAYKRRSNKFITLEIGENGTLNVPSHGLRLFDRICNISKLISPNPNSTLILYPHNGEITPLCANHLNAFNRWIVKKFDLNDDFGRPLTLQPRRFRASGTSRFLDLTGNPIKVSEVANNTPHVLKDNYSSGSKHNNDLQIQATALTLANLSTRRQGIVDAKETTLDQMGLRVLPYETYINSLVPPIRNANGSFCQAPFSEKASNQNLKAVQRGILKEGERLACADLLSCFDCRHQVLVEAVEDIWCILSFRECIEESAYLHLDIRHFEKNFTNLLKAIDVRLSYIDRNVITAAERRLNQNGRHPFWTDASNISFQLANE